MKYYLKLGLILLVFCVVASGILAYVNSITAPKIAAIKQAEAEKARSELIPNAEFELVDTKPGDDFYYYVAKDATSKEIKGYTFTAAKTGYSSKVQTMAGVDPDFKLINIIVIDQAETPGLGANCTNDDFEAQFSGKTVDEMLVDKDGGKIKSLTGATITTRAIANSLKDEITLVKEEVSAANGGGK
jgi:electron transport complex protein RnfG